MTLGERIKAARKSAGLTQAELSGGVITRNMLSKIENNSVMPSLQTLFYISERLHILPGILISGDGDERWMDGFAVSEIRRLFHEGDADATIAACERFPDRESDEINLIRSISYMRRGDLDYSEGRLEASRADYERSLIYSAGTAYISSDVIRHDRIMLDEIARICEKSEGLGIKPRNCDIFLPVQKKYEQICFGRLVEKAVTEHNFSAAEFLLKNIFPGDGFYAKKLKALTDAEGGNLPSAAEQLRDLVYDESVCGGERYLLLGYLEAIYAEMLDYGEASRCSGERAELLRCLLQ